MYIRFESTRDDRACAALEKTLKMPKTKNMKDTTWRSRRGHSTSLHNINSTTNNSDMSLTLWVRMGWLLTVVCLVLAMKLRQDVDQRFLDVYECGDSCSWWLSQALPMQQQTFLITIEMLASRQWQNSSVWASKTIKSVMPAHIKEYKKLVLLMIDCCFELNRSIATCNNLFLIISVCLRQRITPVREEIRRCLHHGECVVFGKKNFVED